MQYEVPFKVNFNLKPDIMNNLTINGASVQNESKLTDNKIKYVLNDEAFIELEYLTKIEPFPEQEKDEILKREPDATFEDSEYTHTLITSNRAFQLELITKVEPLDSGNCTRKISTASLTFI